MYKIICFESRVEKQFDLVKSSFSVEVCKRMLDFLKNTPQLGKPKMQFKVYDLPDGNRVLYKILPKNIVRIVCVGDHQVYEQYLRDFGGKK